MSAPNKSACQKLKHERSTKKKTRQRGAQYIARVDTQNWTVSEGLKQQTFSIEQDKRLWKIIGRYCMMNVSVVVQYHQHMGIVQHNFHQFINLYATKGSWKNYDGEQNDRYFSSTEVTSGSLVMEDNSRIKVIKRRHYTAQHFIRSQGWLEQSQG